METTAAWESEELELMSNASANGMDTESSEQTPNNIKNLRELTFRLLREVQSLGEVHTVDLERGLDFYSEVTRFEVDLIKRALMPDCRTSGSRG